MGDAPTIAAAQEADLPELLALTHRAYARNVELGYRYTGATDPIEGLEKAWREGKVYKFVAAGRIAGSVRLTDHPEGFLEVWRLCVEPAFQRRGFGQALLRFAEEEARRRGFRRVRLDTAKPFRDLVGWYERQGYTIVGETRFPDVNYESVYMEKVVDEIEIRRYRPGDREAVRALHREALEATGTYAGDGPWDADLEDVEGSYLKSGGDFLVAVLEGGIVGMGALVRTGPDRAEIRRMRVRPDLQRQGIGRRILRALEERARAMGCLRLHLDTSARQTGAQRFYLKNGYREVDRRAARGEECVFYERSLGSSTS